MEWGPNYKHYGNTCSSTCILDVTSLVAYRMVLVLKMLSNKINNAWQHLKFEYSSVGKIWKFGQQPYILWTMPDANTRFLCQQT